MQNTHTPKESLVDAFIRRVRDEGERKTYKEWAIELTGDSDKKGFTFVSNRIISAKMKGLLFKAESHDLPILFVGNAPSIRKGDSVKKTTNKTPTPPAQEKPKKSVQPDFLGSRMVACRNAIMFRTAQQPEYLMEAVAEIDNLIMRILTV